MKDLLKKINLFSSLTDDELEEIEKICVRETHAKDTIMFFEGDPGNKCYVIVKGEVRISKMIPNIGEEALAVLKPGDYFGEMALIDNFPRSAHAIANTDMEALAISKTDLDKVLIRDREMGYKLLWVFTQTLSRRLREMNEKMAGFLTMSGGF
ncbi:MAG TPA: cyclic nucleotide-binding domain-containing protein [Nitrospirota bacterium]|jgi:CRP-like cAMP-binding protein|nr:cyclic nucleotide-binding domain-containing protein [Nitrospirota bacterium]